MLRLAIFTAFISIVFTRDIPDVPPSWPDQFEQNFNETIIFDGVGSTQTNGKIFYDWTNRRYRIDRENAQFDKFCGFSSSPCSHIVVNGLRYLYYPEQDLCCYCCNDEQGCGVLKPDWMQGGEFIGFESFHSNKSQIVEKWDKQGQQHNYYYADSETRVMSRIDQQPNDIMDFDTKSFRASISDPSVFNLPSKCSPSAKCPFYSLCAVVRGDDREKPSQRGKMAFLS